MVTRCADRCLGVARAGTHGTDDAPFMGAWVRPGMRRTHAPVHGCGRHVGAIPPPMPCGEDAKRALLEPRDGVRRGSRDPVGRPAGHHRWHKPEPRCILRSGARTPTRPSKGRGGQRLGQAPEFPGRFLFPGLVSRGLRGAVPTLTFLGSVSHRRSRMPCSHSHIIRGRVRSCSGLPPALRGRSVEW